MHKNNESGQALVLGLVLLSILLLMFRLSYQFFQTVQEKTKLTQVADLAAYSGAAVVSYYLNDQSYLHQAQIAHHVASAHLITALSLSQYAKTLSQRSTVGNPPVWLIAYHFGTPYGWAYRSGTGAIGLSPLIQKAMQMHHHASKTLKRLAKQMQYDLYAVRQQVIEQVIQAHYGDQADQVYWEWVYDDLSHLTRWEPWGKDYRRLLQSVTRKYRFLKNREGRRLSLSASVMVCPDMPHTLLRRGHTELTEDGQWQSMDNQSFHKVIPNQFTRCLYREYPMGWGFGSIYSVENHQDTPSNFSRQPFWKWAISQGINLFVVTQNTLAKRYAFRDQLTSGVSAVKERMVLAQHQGRFKLRLRFRNYVSDSVAEVFFEDPEGAQKADLLHAYWHAHLINERGQYE